jgi:hypothetical protein
MSDESDAPPAPTIAPTITQIGALLGQLAVEIDRDVPVVRLEIEDGRALDVFKADRVREHPIVWRTRGFAGDIRPAEFVALLLGTTDGRAIVTAGPGDATAATMNGQAVVRATRSTRRLADLADLIARRVRASFAPQD